MTMKKTALQLAKGETELLRESVADAIALLHTEGGYGTAMKILRAVAVFTPRNEGAKLATAARRVGVYDELLENGTLASGE